MTDLDSVKSPTSGMVNTLFNTSSDCNEVGDYTFTGHNVSIITGTHRCELTLRERVREYPITGMDIVIGRGVWIGSNAIILGLAKIGDHAVIGAGAVVPPGSDIRTGTVVAGVPARLSRRLISPNSALPRTANDASFAVHVGGSRTNNS